VEDVGASGCPALAAATVVPQVGGVVRALAFLMEMNCLIGRARLPGLTVYSVVQY
jgi:adenine/guanine phosphoribosyltransferase-like PRPP-binding protein